MNRKKQVEHELASGTFLIPSTITVGEFLMNWLPKQCTKHKWAPKTYQSNLSTIQNLIVPYIGNMEIAELGKDEIHFYNIDREEIHKDMVEIKWDAESAEKGGYEHFMLKEIHEQPKAVQDTVGAYVKDGQIDLTSDSLVKTLIVAKNRIPSSLRKNLVMFMPTEVFTALEIAAYEKSTNALKIVEAAEQFKTHFFQIPMEADDAISLNETKVS